MLDQVLNIRKIMNNPKCCVRSNLTMAAILHF